MHITQQEKIMTASDGLHRCMNQLREYQQYEDDGLRINPVIIATVFKDVDHYLAQLRECAQP